MLNMRLDKNEKLKLFYYLIFFFLLFMYLIVFFDTIHRSHCTISTNFYFYLQYFQ